MSAGFLLGERLLLSDAYTEHAWFMPPICRQQTVHHPQHPFSVTTSLNVTCDVQPINRQQTVHDAIHPYNIMTSFNVTWNMQASNRQQICSWRQLLRELCDLFDSGINVRGVDNFLPNFRLKEYLEDTCVRIKWVTNYKNVSIPGTKYVGIYT